jgi:HD-like signal output (HDOD) protein
MNQRLKIPAFENLRDKELVELYNIAKPRKTSVNEVIIREGDLDQTLYLIIEGLAGVFKNTQNGKTHIDTLREGDWFGEIALIKHVPRTATVVALNNLQLLSFDSPSFLRLSENLQLKILKNLFDIAIRRIEDMQHKTIWTTEKVGRLALYINDYISRAESCIRSELIQKIIKKISKLPKYTTDLAAKILNENSPPAEIAEIIKTDPSLTSLILKIVNSPYYGLPVKVSDLYHAYLLLGASQVYNLVIDSGLKGIMPKTKEFLDLQLHSYLVSIIARETAIVISKKELCNFAGTIGLLHDIGKSIILLLKTQNPNMKTLIEMLNPAHLGAFLLSNWNLPEKICKTIKLQFHPEFMPPENIQQDIRNEISILYLAARCTDRLTGETGSDLKEIYFAEYLSLFNLKPKACYEFMKEDVFPLLIKNKNVYPQQIRELIENKQLSL